MTTGYEYLTKSESNNHRFWVFDKMRGQRTTGSGYLPKCGSKNRRFWFFQNAPRTAGFHERTVKEPEVLWMGICHRYSALQCTASKSLQVLKLFKALHFRVSLGLLTHHTLHLAPTTQFSFPSFSWEKYSSKLEGTKNSV